ncbi:MAG: hypothetical protein ACYDCO_03230 [Armatimonadota bacterium]
MSVPMHKPGRTPESYTPKKPEIASVMQERTGQPMQPGLNKAHRVNTEGGGAYIDFDYPFSGFRDLDFTNCFTCLYMYLEDFAGETGVLKQQQERLFFLFDTVSGRSATVPGWGGVPTAIYREIYDTDDMAEFLMGYAGYAYAKHTDNLAEHIRTSIDRGIPVLARMKKDGTPYVDSNEFLAIAGGDSFRVIVGYHGDGLRMAEPNGAQNPPQEAPTLEDIASVYVITAKAVRQFTLLDGLRRIKRVMDCDREAGAWDQYINAFENYGERLKGLSIEELKQRFEYAHKGTTWNCHNFAETFRTLEYLHRERRPGEPVPEQHNNWIWDELKDPRLGTIPTRAGQADDDPLRLPPETLISWACDESHNRQWQIHALVEVRDWSKKQYDLLEWAYCETAAQFLRQVKEYDGYVYQAVCAMIGILEGTKP